MSPQFAAHLWLEETRVGSWIPLRGRIHGDAGDAPGVLLAVQVQVELCSNLVRAVGEFRPVLERDPGTIVSEWLGNSQQMVPLTLRPIVVMSRVLHKIFEPGLHSQVLLSQGPVPQANIVQDACPVVDVLL
ncbi:MAG: hypothetical protein ACK559_35340, partial [bacterium]